MNWEQIAGGIRHVLTFLGGYLVAKGWVTADMLPEIVGAVTTLVGLVWSFLRKTDKSIVTQAAAVVPVPAASQREVGITAPVVTAPTPGKGV